MDERKYQIQNDNMVQRQVVGDYPLINQHFHGTHSLSQPPASLTLTYNENATQQLETLIAEFKNKYSSSIDEIVIDLEKVKTACESIRDSWSGSCLGYHSRLYYGDFEKPPRDKKFSVEWGGIYSISEKWRERTLEEVKIKIVQLVGNNFSVDKFEKDNEKLAYEIEDFEIQVELLVSSITAYGSHHPLEKIEKIEPRKNRDAYIRRLILLANPFCVLAMRARHTRFLHCERVRHQDPFW